MDRAGRLGLAGVVGAASRQSPWACAYVSARGNSNFRLAVLFAPGAVCVRRQVVV